VLLPQPHPSRWAGWLVLNPAPGDNGAPSRDRRPVRARSSATTTLWPPAWRLNVAGSQRVGSSRISAAIAACCAIPLSKWLVFIRPSLAGFDRPLTSIRTKSNHRFPCAPVNDLNPKLFYGG